MIENSIRILEICSMLVCIHLLYGKKPRKIIDIPIMIIADMLTLNLIETFQINNLFAAIVNVEILVYCIYEFRGSLRELFSNTVLYIVIVSAMQVFGAFIFSFINTSQVVKVLGCGTFVLVISVGLLPMLHLHKVSLYLQRRNITLYSALLVSIFFTYSLIVRVKKTGMAQLDWFLLLSIGVLWICFLAYKWQINQSEVENERKMFQVYRESSETYGDEIEKIRSKQHDYKNMINAVLSQHYTCKTMEELVGEQKKYCDILLEDARKQDVIDIGNKAVSAFIFTKKKDAQVHGINILYRGKIKFEDESAYFIMKQMEILGNLLDNATEATEQRNCEKRIIVRAVEDDRRYGFEVMNPIEEDEVIDFSKIMQRGYSSKGNNRGYGLSNVKEICEEIDCELSVTLKKYENQKWICFRVIHR